MSLLFVQALLVFVSFLRMQILKENFSCLALKKVSYRGRIKKDTAPTPYQKIGSSVILLLG